MKIEILQVCLYLPGTHPFSPRYIISLLVSNAYRHFSPSLSFKEPVFFFLKAVYKFII